jgi:hypothetical protein
MAVHTLEELRERVSTMYAVVESAANSSGEVAKALNIIRDQNWQAAGCLSEYAMEVLRKMKWGTDIRKAYTSGFDPVESIMFEVNSFKGDNYQSVILCQPKKGKEFDALFGLDRKDGGRPYPNVELHSIPLDKLPEAVVAGEAALKFISEDLKGPWYSKRRRRQVFEKKYLSGYYQQKLNDLFNSKLDFSQV